MCPRRTEREKLYNCWKEQLRSGWHIELKLALRQYERVRDEQRRIHADVDLNVLKGARLVGMTTAGVANKQDLVAAMAPKVQSLQRPVCAFRSVPCPMCLTQCATFK